VPPSMPAPAPNRDLYVYIDIRNMPDKRSPKDPPIDSQRLGGTRERLAKLKIELPQSGGIGENSAKAIAQAYARGSLSFEEVAALLPTYAAYVWYDTGKTVVGSGGTPLKRLEAQPSFGLFLWHDGDLYGWRHNFEGSNITEIAPNYFRISAPTNGVAKVSVSVTACEDAACKEKTTPPGPTDEHHPRASWKILLIALGALLLLIILFLLFRKKN